MISPTAIARRTAAILVSKRRAPGASVVTTLPAEVARRLSVTAGQELEWIEDGMGGFRECTGDPGRAVTLLSQQHPRFAGRDDGGSAWTFAWLAVGDTSQALTALEELRGGAASAWAFPWEVKFSIRCAPARASPPSCARSVWTWRCSRRPTAGGRGESAFHDRAPRGRGFRRFKAVQGVQGGSRGQSR
jgi:hypothetical protein